MLTDTHCHLDIEAFDADRPQVIRRALDAGLTRMLVPGLSVDSSRRCVELAAAHASVYAAVGIHPTERDPLPEDAMQQLREQALRPKVVAIGEIGLDYYWVHEPEQQAHQRQLLEQQLRLAGEVHKPVVLHAREKGDADHGSCSEDLLAILKKWVEGLPAGSELRGRPGVLHSFSGSLDTARRAIQLGFCIGVTGPVTYKSADARRELIGQLPLDSLLIETDAPYLAPVPFRGKRNEPAYVAHIADKIAAIHARTSQEVAAVTGSNANRLFSWGDAA